MPEEAQSEKDIQGLEHLQQEYSYDSKSNDSDN